MIKAAFAGHRKVGSSLLSKPEQWLVRRFVDKVPRWLETYHLTALTIVWSALLIVFALLSRINLSWFWVVSVLIVLQYLTDLFDGAVGRKRNTGLVKWGFFMDHFLDYVFNCCLFIGYAIISPPGLELWFYALIAIAGGYMVLTYIGFATLNEFQIYYFGIGPTEIRIFFIALNTIFIYTGTAHFPRTIPAATVIAFLGLVVLGYFMHRKLWALDMAEKEVTQLSD